MISASCFDEYDQVRSAEHSGEMVCIVKYRLSAEYKVSKPLSKADLFLRGRPFQPEGIPGFDVRDCTSLNEKTMSLKTDDGVYLWIDDQGDVRLTKLKVVDGNLSNDLKWMVTQEKRIDPFTGNEEKLKTKLPSEFLGNSPDWKTVITAGENLVDKDLISLYVVDLETGVAKRRYIRRQPNMWMLDASHQIAGLVSDNLWISRHFQWEPDSAGRDVLIYPVLEPEEPANKLADTDHRSNK